MQVTVFFNLAPCVISKLVTKLDFKPFALLVYSNCTVTNKLVAFYSFLPLSLFWFEILDNKIDLHSNIYSSDLKVNPLRVLLLSYHT